ncbi:hypothetical protein O3M35_012179 [Rhynocoris fuscipes]|uniref:G-protein coupled receptors family 1 profile domain-containing protein n=1 Tax=Rhynocoris fuscipes TaxID=488301 RepID=A0AAW1CRH1_9HEMI
MCTASILNLCAISLDRYVAVTRPVTYPSIMSTTRAKILIAAVWVLSFLICFPPLVGWKDTPSQSSSSTVAEGPEPPCPWRCELTNDAGYVIYSALGSFYLPMFVMLFFYWRIYRAAVMTTRAINQGFKLTKGSRGIGSRFDEQRLTLRIHRGRGSVMQGSSGSNSTTTTNSAGTTTTSAGGKSPVEKKSTRRHERIKISVSYPSSDAISSVNNNSPPPTSPKSSISSSSPPPNSGQLFAVNYTGVTIQKDLSPSPTYDENNPAKPKLISRMGKRNIKAQVKRFRMETKAAKTLGIIVGGFIFCWLPFFTMYLVLAFCGECIHPMVFSVLFWLGYCNSAINPCIYALFSKDFRFAFKRIICKCMCYRERNQHGSTKYMRRGSDGSHLGIRRSDQRSSSLNNNELMPNHHNNHPPHHHSDSDVNNEAGSESR